MRTFRLLGACILGLFSGFGVANASTVFDITGNSSYSGTLTIDTVLGTITSADVIVSGAVPPDYTNILATPQGATTIRVAVANGTVTPPPVGIISLVIEDAGTLIGFTGGAIDSAFHSGLCDLPSGFCRGGADLGTGQLTPELSGVPLPGALPLFATGLGALGLLGWRRKKKAAASA
jgi:hypothetical protein